MLITTFGRASSARCSGGARSGLRPRRHRRREAPRGGRSCDENLALPESVARHFARCDAVVDLTGFPQRGSWGASSRTTCALTVNAVEAAREAGVGRYVFASSNHVTGLYERDEPYASIVCGHTDALSPETLPRSPAPIRSVRTAPTRSARRSASPRLGLPPRPRAISGLPRIETVSALNRPGSPRSFATLLTPRPRPARALQPDRPSSGRFGIYYDVSGNRWRFWEIETATEDLGYEPQDDAEQWR